MRVACDQEARASGLVVKAAVGQGGFEVEWRARDPAGPRAAERSNLIPSCTTSSPGGRRTGLRGRGGGRCSQATDCVSAHPDELQECDAVHEEPQTRLEIDAGGRHVRVDV